VSNLKEEAMTTATADPATETFETREAWLATRRTGLGSSDIPVLFGLSPWKSRFELWAEKVGAAEPDAAETEAMEWGLRLQPLVAAKYAEETGRRIVQGSPYAIRRHPRLPFLLASLDAEILPWNGRGPGALECKTASAWKADDWADAPPLLYQVQLQTQLVVAEWTWGSLAVLIGGQRFRWVDLEVHAGIAELIEEKATAFWERVTRGDPPLPDGSESAKEILARMYPRERPGVTISLPPEAVAWDAQLEDAKAQIEGWELKKREAENLLRGALGDAEKGLLVGGAFYTSKLVERKEHVVKASSYRQLRRGVVK
jgi:putative phage-type endonuclease